MMVSAIVSDMVFVFVSRKRNAHIKGILAFHRTANVIRVIINHTTKNAVTKRLIKLDCRAVRLTHEKIDEPTILLLARFFQSSGKEPSISKPTILGSYGQCCDMAMPW